MSNLDTETTHETTTFEHFGQTWTVPTKRHLSHIRKMRDEIKAGYGSLDLLIAETFLSPDDFDRLLVVDPAEDALGEFTNEIANALGLGDSGNSSPSSASS